MQWYPSISSIESTARGSILAVHEHTTDHAHEHKTDRAQDKTQVHENAMLDQDKTQVHENAICEKEKTHILDQGDAVLHEDKTQVHDHPDAIREEYGLYFYTSGRYLSILSIDLSMIDQSIDKSLSLSLSLSLVCRHAVGLVVV